MLHRHPGGNPGANLGSISHRCHPILVAFVWELTEASINLPLGCLQGGLSNLKKTFKTHESTLQGALPL